ncbi:unnamed protein product [Adineta ricciae]|uniref:Uncharacterized protein n=1 Tax=Adineta ricciae TaxID=249248 RepID=A0A815KT54_ADIRI|nr:unnamed protein product [Adineta ricciae]CAF1400456.1 unnamed protein product [Adineta ricciae]
MNNRLVVLLDPPSRQLPAQSNLGHRVQHFLNRDICIQHILTQMPNYQRIDFFLSSHERTLVGAEIALLQNVYFHIYYPTNDDIPNDYNNPCMWIKTFEERELWMRISFTIYHHDWMSHVENNFGDATLNVLRNTYNILLQEVQAAQLSVETSE